MPSALPQKSAERSRSKVSQSMMKPDSLLLCMRCSKFANLTRGSHEISTYDGAGDGHRAVAALLSRRARPERIIAQGLSAGALHAGFLGGAERGGGAGRTHAPLVSRR